MGVLTNIRVRIADFFKRNDGYIIVSIIVIFFLFNFNNLYKSLSINTKPITIGNSDRAVMYDESNFPKKITNEGKEKIEEFLKLCNNREYDKAYELLSEDCKKYEFKNKEEAIGYMIRIFPYNRKYDIQAYISQDNYYIYQVKIFDDFLKTGLTKKRYEFDDEKITIADEDGKLKLNIRGYIKSEDIDGMYEDNNIKVQLLKRNIKFMNEDYIIKVTNRNDKTLVLNEVSNGKNGQIYMHIGEDIRKIETEQNIIIEPLSTKEITISFPKLFDLEKVTTKIEFAEVKFTEKFDITNDKYTNKYSISVNIGK